MFKKQLFVLLWLLCVCSAVATTQSCITIGPIFNATCGGVVCGVDILINGVDQGNVQKSSIISGGVWFSTPVTVCGDAAPNESYFFWVGSQPNPGTTPSEGANGRGFPSGSTITGTVAGSAGSCTPGIQCLATNQTYSYTYVNTSPDYVMVVATLDGSLVCMGQASGNSGNGFVVVPPGQTGTVTYGPIPVGCSPPSTDGNVQFETWAYQGWGSVGGCATPQGYASGSPQGPTTVSPGPGGTGQSGGGGSGGAGVPGGTGAGTGSPDPVYSPTNTSPITYNPTNSPGGTNPATDGTLQEGLAAIYDAINRNGSAIGGDLVTLDKDQQAMLAINGSGFLAASNLLVQTTNKLGQMLTTNLLGFVGVSNAVFTSGNTITNWIGEQTASNLLNARMLSNTIAGLSNGIVWSGTNSSVFLSNSFAAVMGSLTNLGGGGTNAFSDSGITNAIVSQHTDITNYLAMLTDTNLGAAGLLRASDLPSFTTNGDAAAAALGSQLSAGQTLSDAIGADADTLSGLPAGASGGSGLSLAFMGQTLNLDPDAIIPGSCNFVYYLTELVIVIGFYLSCGKLYYSFMSDLSKLRGSQVPNLNMEVFGVGGNFLGAAVHPAICAAIITLWAGALVVVVGKIPSSGLIQTAVTGASGAVGIGGGVAWNLINRTIPIPLMMSLIATRIGLQFTMGTLILGVAGVMRFFIGG